ncbi:MAG: VWA domain-containing protein [Acidobacteriia bacterium]|nr:VWA domain-containing protein [Terriglobia bacterium]
MRRIVVALTLTCLVAAQQPPANAPVKFTANAQLVVETVSVTGKDGKPIEGLTAKDFVVTEDGVPQTVSFCEYQKLAENPGPLPSARPEAQAEKAKADPVVRTQITPESPGDIRYRDRRLLALYFDMSAMPVQDQVRAQIAAVKFIRTQMTPADLMAIMAFSDSVKVLQDFTDNRDDLLKTVNKLFIGEAQGFDEADQDESSADTGSAFGEDDSEFNLFNTNRQLAALQTAVKMLGTLNEKKVLIYFASGLRLNGVDNQAQFQATTNAAIRANVSFYSIDARGLVAQAPMGDATQGSPGGIGMYTGRSALAAAANFQRSQDTLYALAADTGGKALLDNNDLAAGVVQAQQSISSYYIIGYYSANAALDGRFRRIRITYSDPSARLAYRQGYYAGKVFSKFTSADKERQLQDALMLGDPITELTIQLEVDYFQLNSAEYFIPVVAKIPGSELALARKGGAERTLIDFIGEVKDEYGVTVANVRDKVDIKLSGATAAQLARQPIQYDTGFTLLPGSYTLKFLARDDETGRIGTYISKFVIPNLDKEQKRIPISSVVLSGQRVDLKDALYTAGKDKAPSANPLIQDGHKLIPSVTRVFSKSRDMYVYLQAYQRGAAGIQPLVAFVSFYRGQTKAFETPPLQVAEGINNKLKTVPMRFSLALRQLPPGRYNCQVSVVDPTGQKAAFWQAPVLLVP